MNAQRLAAFAVGEGITVGIADDAALNELKQQYGTPIAIISGEYESKKRHGIYVYRRCGFALSVRDGNVGCFQPK